MREEYLQSWGSKSGTKNFFISGIILILLIYSPPLSQAEQITISGLTEPAQDSALGLSITGQIISIKVKIGDVVKPGQLLLQLDQELERLEVKRRKLIWESKAEINSVSRQVSTLAQHLQATRDLYQSTGSVPREELENKELEYDFAVAEKEQLQIAELREKVEYDAAREQLAKRNLYAPFAGQIAEIMIGPGENCDIDTPLLRLVDNSHGYFVANIEQGTATHLQPGQNVQLQLGDTTEPVNLEAQIVFVSPLIDPASGLRKIKAVFDNREKKVIPGVAGLLQLPNRE